MLARYMPAVRCERDLLTSISIWLETHDNGKTIAGSSTEDLIINLTEGVRI